MPSWEFMRISMGPSARKLKPRSGRSSCGLVLGNFLRQHPVTCSRGLDARLRDLPEALLLRLKAASLSNQAMASNHSTSAMPRKSLSMVCSLAL